MCCITFSSAVSAPVMLVGLHYDSESTILNVRPFNTAAVHSAGF